MEVSANTRLLYTYYGNDDLFLNPSGTIILSEAFFVLLLTP
tara:strand:+ start:32 stop:154 length:123 start_codon:yes stop_codon:yes gene_type:complete